MILIISRKQSKVIIVCLWKINEKYINVVNSKIHMSKVKRKKKKATVSIKDKISKKKMLHVKKFKINLEKCL